MLPADAGLQSDGCAPIDRRRRGLEEVLELRLSAPEEEALRTSAQVLGEAQAEVFS
jgi:malate/lactate dehydrogenase